MVSKNKTGEKKGKVKVGKLRLNRETVKDLTAREEKQIKGGLAITVHYQCVRLQTVGCPTQVIRTCSTCPDAGCADKKQA